MSRLFIISGHGAGDSGAVGNGYQEAERVRALATKIKEYGDDNVILSDFNLNSYRTDIITTGIIPKDCEILELHLDSSNKTTAKGGHIIKHTDLKADKYDNALAKTVSTMFPGRSTIISKRKDLANVCRAKSSGYNYRLLECCFISNVDDIKKFNSNIDSFAKKILECFEIAVKEKTVVVKKSVEEIAKEVLAGKWGNGTDRKNRLAAAGYDYSAVQAKVNELSGKKTTATTATVATTTPKVNYFAKYTGTSGSIVPALNSMKITSSFSYRSKIAKANGIKLYAGTSKQNTTMLNLLKQGKLIKP